MQTITLSLPDDLARHISEMSAGSAESYLLDLVREDLQLKKDAAAIENGIADMIAGRISSRGFADVRKLCE